MRQHIQLRKLRDNWDYVNLLFYPFILFHRAGELAAGPMYSRHVHKGRSLATQSEDPHYSQALQVQIIFSKRAAFAVRSHSLHA